MVDTPEAHALANQFVYAMVAKHAPQDKGRLALGAIAEHYTNLGVGDDPIIGAAIATGNRGLKASGGKMTSPDLLEAMNLYSEKFNTAYGEMTVKQAVEYSEANGYGDTPDDARAFLSNYSNNKVKNLDSTDDDQKKVLLMLQDLMMQTVETDVTGVVMTKMTTASLEHLADSE
jgi:hypothetical protein